MVEHRLAKARVASSNLVSRFLRILLSEKFDILCASGSVVEHRLAKARVASSNLVSRFLFRILQLSYDGLSPSGKAQDFDSCIRWFESS